MSLRTRKMELKLLAATTRLLGPWHLRVIRDELVPTGSLDPRFEQLVPMVQPYTLLSIDRLFVLYRLVESSAPIPGNIAEAGIFRGGSLRLLREAARGFAPDKTVHGFDSFSGLPSPSRQVDGQFHAQGDFAAGMNEVSQYLSTRGPSDIQLHRVLFAPGMPSAPDSGEPWALVHLDLDLRDSVAGALSFFEPQVSRGGYVIIDDYGFRSTPGAREAVNAYCRVRKLTPIYFPTGQALIVKPERQT